MIKIILIGPYLAGQQPCNWPNRLATWAPSYMKLEFFIKCTPLNFDFVQKKVNKNWNRSNLSWLADSQLYWNSLHCRAPITWVSNFFIKRTPFNIVVRNSRRIFKSVYSWPIGRPPQNGASNTWVEIFLIKWTPYEFGFCVKKC